ncbi:aminotransferase class I/II-fold pyridoxal phosphate-dependent enzyme [Leptotrichia sp. oral taxon 847]|uniref:aminotransferase class I/II-fold pyridoxal phosphate-dependent enzyme n=1 Tax=Leptotrichia sp. oral taxon 847 TaxID=1785996 RepID=UPI0007681AE0|nr:aminotransferase class I/II-fold pyridoxal phosphate-dependent enzyme [Leptotrichia sp. oral taxon 847]AMD95546.1 arginine decarboxylase [Leptotrichia sp. oral taxon 847]
MKKNIDLKRQKKTVLFDALKEHLNNRVVRFDVPGHKGGRGNKEFRDFIGIHAMQMDVNSMKPLDNLCHPTSVIKEAQEIAAEAFGAKEAYFMVSGTTGAVQAMIMSTCRTGDKLIIPRNVHRSAINAMVVCGAVPVYINPGLNKKLGISLGMSIKDVKKAIKENPDAKAILVNNPTYYGICSDLKSIVKLAHENGMYVLVDEAHGAHFSFDENLPISAMEAGADMAAISMHKTGGSLTQSSILLSGEKINADYVRKIINLTQTTSASYLLMASLDVARKNLVINGRELFEKTVKFAEYARSEINKLGGYYAYGKELIDGDAVFDFDTTKLSVYTKDIGLAGIEVYDILRDEYGIQIELGDLGNILSIITAGDRGLEIERLISSLAEIKRLYSKNSEGMFDHEYINPKVVMTPQDAFYSEKEMIPILDSVGRVSAEFVMAYPPGIPILAPGEKITDEIIRYISYAKEKGCLLTGTEDMHVDKINVVLKK